jgi:CARDB.
LFCHGSPDQTLPDARISNINTDVSEAEVGTQVKLTIDVTNEGVAELPSEIPVKIYHRGESGAIATLYTSSALAVGESLQVSRTITLPTTVGNHSYYAVVNENNKVNELSFTNNTSVDAVVKVIAPFSVTITTDKENIYAG